VARHSGASRARGKGDADEEITCAARAAQKVFAGGELPNPKELGILVKTVNGEAKALGLSEECYVGPS
jgi:hypothetical protein